MTEAPPSTHDQLGTAAALAEQGFFAAGQKLADAVGILERLATRFAAYIAEFTGDALSDTSRDLAAAGAQVAALADGRRADLRDLDTLSETVATAAQRLAALLPIAQEIAILSLSARVVAGGMGQEAADFAIFADGIRDAAQRARICVDAARTGLGLAGQELAATHAEMAGFMRRHGTAMATIPERLAANLRSLTAQRARAAEAVVAAHDQSEVIRQEVAAQIVALQLGDITRQRLEHVQAAVRIATNGEGLAGDLLAAQLVDTADELARKGEQVEAGLRQLVVAAQTIGQLGVQLHSDDRGADFIAALDADIRQTATLFAELSTGDSANDRRMAAVQQATGTLAARLAEVQSVQEDLRIMGLNASLKCGRLGVAGRPLAAVAQELRLCGGRFGANAATVLGDLGRLRQVAETLCDPSRNAQHAESARATDALLLPLRRLNRLEQDLTALLAQLRADAAEVGSLVEAALAQFEVRQTLAVTLHAVAAGFAGWPRADRCPRELLDRIAACYTMAREREIHARFAPLAEAAQEADVFF
ncbi:MAG TPA: hypothetical protein VMB34_29855 [Acetobacteraceae bacterium]|nr:hypothetical protein [Acetobacteraceae bacterium]